jgi:uncharacterized protein (TIGR02302 family)
VLGLALALGLSGLTARLSPWLHLAALAGLGVLALAALVSGIRHFHWPSREEAWRHLETGDAIHHRPLTAATDHLALGGDDPFGALLWRAHRKRMARAARGLRPHWPRSQVPALDPRGLRVLPLLALVVALAMGHRDPGARLGAFLTPDVWPEPVVPVAHLWLTPPDYTGEAPIRLDTSAPGPNDALDAPLRVPEGTTLLVLVHGENLDDALPGARLVAGLEGPPLAILDAGTLRAEGTLTKSGRLTLRLDEDTLVDRPLEVRADTPPAVAFAEEPRGDDRGRTRLALRVGDDYGLANAQVEIRPVEPLEGDGADALTVDLPLRPGVTGPLVTRATPDLAAHRWAGRRVVLRPRAEDVRGHATLGDPEFLDLPERHFTHPAAQAIIALRKMLTNDPETYWRVMRSLDGLAARPQATDGDLTVHLALRAVRAHLSRHRRTADLEYVRGLLWSAASRLEDGALSQVSGDLDRLSDDLRDALAGDPSQADIDRLLRQTREALSAMSRAMADSMRQMPQGLSPDLMPRAPVDLGAMDKLLRDMADMNRLGAKDAIKDMLARLERMVDQMRSLQSMRASPAQTQAMEEMRAMNQALSALRESQAGLMDDTFRQDQAIRNREGLTPIPGDQGATPMGIPRAVPTPTPSAESDALAGRQKALTEQLESLLGQLGEKTGQVPRDLGDAALAMGEARAGLEGGDLPTALAAQGRALDLLSKGRRSAMRSMMNAMGGGMPMVMPLPGDPSGGPRPGQDPLGRGIGGGDGDRVGLPDGSEAQRARTILEELRRRANDPERVQPERDYLDRLIPKF